MESLSPLVKSGTVRRRSLELVGKVFVNSSNISPTTVSATNFATSNVATTTVTTHRLSPNAGKPRRASVAALSSPVTFSGQTPFNSPIGGGKPSRNSLLDEAQRLVAPSFAQTLSNSPKKEPGNSAVVKCNIIPPTPRRRRSTPNSSPSSTVSGSSVWNSSLSDVSFNGTLSDENNNDLASAPPSAAYRRHGRRKSSTATAFGVTDDLVTLVQKHWALFLDQCNVLGRGSFGIVVGAKYQGKKVAVKLLHGGKDEEALQGELNALKLMPHPHIVDVLDVVRIPGHRSMIILEQMKKDNLLALINDPQGKLPLGMMTRVATQVSSALTYCHSQGILHLDVKPQNILVHSSGTFKLADFGNSKRLEDLKSVGKITKLDGTVGYKAPELFRGDPPTEKSDIYSLGITMWHMRFREQPYLGENEHSVIYKVVAQNLRPKSILGYLHTSKSPLMETYENLYTICWDKEVSNRPTAHQLLRKLENFQNKISGNVSS